MAENPLGLLHEPDHYSEAVKELPSQHRRPFILALLKALCEPVQELEDELVPLRAERFIDDVVGVYLEQYGSIVNEPRHGLSDDDYRRIIKAAIPSYFSSGSVNDVLTIGARLFKSMESGPHYVVLPPAAFSVRFVTEDTPSAPCRRRMKNILNRSKPISVQPEYVLSKPGGFRFSSSADDTPKTKHGFNHGKLAGLL